jgi:hypothetical protein
MYEFTICYTKFFCLVTQKVVITAEAVTRSNKNFAIFLNFERDVTNVMGTLIKNIFLKVKNQPTQICNGHWPTTVHGEKKQTRSVRQGPDLGFLVFLDPT